MAYDPNAIIVEVLRLLQQDLGCTLEQVASSLGVDRHTVAKVITTFEHCSFRDLQCRVRQIRLEQLLVMRGVKSKKEIAILLGFSSVRSMWRSLRRRDRS